MKLIPEESTKLVLNPESAPASDRQPDAAAKPLGRMGLRGYIRLTRVAFTFLWVALRVLLNARTWPPPKQSKSELRRREGALIREKLISLGPTFIKIGQTLATRADILPIEYVQEISKLQDEVPPFPAAQARSIIERELNAPIGEIFSEFEDEPVAAASLGQVHSATLLTGQAVAVKVKRPGLAAQINLDINVLRRIARWLERFPNLIRGVEWRRTLEEFRTTVFEEMDYQQEIRNAEMFRSNFTNWKEVYVPQVYHVFCTPSVIVMEFVSGYKVTDVEALRSAGFNPGEVVKLLAQTYLKQLLEDGFFHADPHPGNLRVMPDGRLAFFDFGMVGRLQMEMQSKLINAFFHTIERDVHGLVDDMVRLGFIRLSPEEEARFKPLIEALLDRYLSLRIGQIQFKELIFDIAHVVYEFPFRIPANFTYVIRAIMTLEGIGTIVDPGFAFFEVARPYAKRFMFRREGRYLRGMFVNRLFRGQPADIEWGKIWKLAKMAVKYYIRGENRL
jgi:predicted unusual protein kinase regulating ubiquinone biosynthesis (AarF/ABC1/UbiB family)